MEYLVVLETVYRERTIYLAATGNLGDVIKKVALEYLDGDERAWELIELTNEDLERYNGDSPQQPGTFGEVFYDITVETYDKDKEAATIIILQIPEARAKLHDIIHELEG